ncbi:hypothetical protein [Agromyces sp. SYSU T00194]|uniref:hypothetical protein n=1 Tax=Agromyces chitinivorans TaxID=3158560 RepID=UPI0033992A08
MSGWDGNGWTPGTWTITLNYPRPPKGLSANDRVHHLAKYRATQAIRQEVAVKVQALRVPKLERVRVDVVWWVTDRRRRDVDNLSPLLKAIYDGIGADKGVSAHVVPDDAPEFMVKPSATIELLPAGRAHFEVRITNVGGAA